MQAERNNIHLDDDARQLFQEFGGLDEDDRAINDSFESEESDDIKSEEARLDEWRINMIELAHLLTSYFQDVRFLEGVKKRTDVFGKLSKTMKTLSKIPDNDGKVLIRYRGFPTGANISPRLDYVIWVGDISVDASISASMFNRMGVGMTHLAGRINKAFKVFSEHGINTLYLNLASETKEDFRALKTSLGILSRYNLAFKTNSPIIFEKNGVEVRLPLISDERGQADRNLTILTGLNSLQPKYMESLVKKVHGMIRGTSQGDRFVNVYEAIFAIKSMKGKLKKPPIEVNNVKWLATDSAKTAMTKEKATVSRLVASEFGSSPQKAAQMIQTVYGDDYNKIGAKHFGERLGLASDLLDSIRKTENSLTMEKEVYKNVRKRFDDVKEDVFDNISVKKNMLRVRSGDKETIIGRVNSRMKSMVNFYKGRAAIKKKMKKMVGNAIDFDARDYETVAKDFGISPEDARNLIELLKSCFDERGRFVRSVFERNIPEFAKYERKVFEFMWHYLKETKNRSDRVAFLNSLQLLIAKMKQPLRAIKFLISDVLGNPDSVEYSDRNAFMMGNLLLRTYNKELNKDIEITPEEVLLVRDGLDKKVVKATAKMLQKDQESLFKKFKQIQTELMESLEAGRSSSDGMPLRYILSLEREAYIFLSLVGGDAARSVLRSALVKYGNPNSEIHRRIRENSMLLLQHLNVLVRAFSRIGKNGDKIILEEIKDREKDFIDLGQGDLHRVKVRRMMQWVDSAITSVTNA